MRFYLVVESSRQSVPARLFMKYRSHLRWNRDGEVRRIPPHVVEDALRNDSRITWDQCEPLPEQRFPVTLNPRPARS